MNIVLAKLGGKGFPAWLPALVMIVFQYWLNVTSVKGFPADDVKSWGTSLPVPCVMRLWPSPMCASKSLVNGPDGKA